jgi:O-antigen biosynthesis alpha-1,2-mannosyltransferase
MRLGLLLRNIGEKGGIAVYTRFLTRNLLAQDSDNEYYLFAARPEALEEFANATNAVPVVLPCRQKFYWDQVQVLRAAHRLGLDLVFGPKMSIPLRFRGLKVITIHGAEQFLLAKQFALLDRWYVQTLMPLYARAADCILTPSETAREGLAQVLGVPLEKFVVTPEGAKDIFRERITPERLRQVRRKYELTGEFILHVGLIWGSKNFEVLPEVLELVNQRRPLLLVHAGKAERWGEGQGIASRFIRRTGFVPDEDLAALYQSALALVFPSIYEGFGIPIVEALASGCPVVTTNWGTMKEIAGDAALLVDARKPQEIADAVLRLATDPALRQELQSRGLERAKRFTWQETARLTLQAFRSLGDRPARTAGQTIGRRLDERGGGTGR